MPWTSAPRAAPVGITVMSLIWSRLAGWVVDADQADGVVHRVEPVDHRRTSRDARAVLAIGTLILLKGLAVKLGPRVVSWTETQRVQHRLLKGRARVRPAPKVSRERDDVD